MALGWVQQHHLGRVGSPRVRGRGCCDSSLDMGLGNMGHVGEAVGQLLMGMDGIYSGWLGKAALRGLGRRSRWQRRRCACQGPWTGLGAACWDCGWLPVGVVAGCGWWAWSCVAWCG